MRDGFWIPTDDGARRDERPFLEAPSPFEYMPWEPMVSEDVCEDEEPSRVIIIEM